VPHKACFHCNLLFEVDAAHVASMLPCPECGRMLEDHAPAPAAEHTQERTIPTQPMDGGGATKMLRVPDLRAGAPDHAPRFDSYPTSPQRSASRHFDVATQAIALDSIGGSVDVPPPDPSVEIPTQAYRTVPVDLDDEAPTKALNANALRDAITEGMIDEAPTRHLNAKALRAGAEALPKGDLDDATCAWTKDSVPTDFGQDAPTRALRAVPADILTSARPVGSPPRTPVEAGGANAPMSARGPEGASGRVPARRPSPPSARHGVSGPLPKRRAPKPVPVAATPVGSPVGPPPARPLATPAGPPPARPLGVAARAAPAQPPAARPIAVAPTPRPVAAAVSSRAVAAPAPAPVPVAIAAPARVPVSAARAVPLSAPAPPPGEDHHSYFDQSRAIDLPDALGALLGEVGEAPAVGSAPASRSTVARPMRKKSKRTLVVILVTFLVVIAGAIVLVVTRDTDPGKTVVAANEPEAPPSEAVDDGSAWQKTFDTALTRAKARLPAVTQGDDLGEGDFIVASPDGLATQSGSVVGLMSTPFPDGSLETTPAGEQAKPLLGALRGGGERPLFAAIDRRVKARTVAQILNSARTSGYTEIRLVGRRGGDNGDLIALPVKTFIPGTPLPSAGGVELRIGQLGMNAVVKGRDGRPLSGRPATVPRTGGVFDFNALDALLDKLSSGHPMVRDVVVYVNGDLGLETLMGVLGRVRGSAARDRFPSISLSVK
jgi:hypothetical protein